MTDFFEIDRDKCQRDGICAAICPLGLITQEGEAFPEAAPNPDRSCIACGHCAAVCPTGALSLTKAGFRDCLPIREELTVSADAAEQFLKTRRSIRIYRKEPVPRDLLERVIDSARWAPSASNLQPVRWIVVEKSEDVRHLAGLAIEWLKSANLVYGRSFLAAWEQGKDMVLRDAPHLVIAYASAENVWAPGDCAIALTYLELAAKAHGLGTCWAGLFKRAAASSASIGQYLGLAADQEVFGAVMLGYPKYGYHRMPKRNEAVVKWL